MKKHWKITITILSSLFGIVLGSGGFILIHLNVTNTWTELDTFIERKMDNGHVPGLSYGIMKDGELVNEGYLGYAELETNTFVTEDTLFDVASTSKLITTTAVMILVNNGTLDLDEDLEPILPFSIRHPDYPSIPITTRMLLTHTSSIVDNWDAYDSTYTTDENGDGPGGDSPLNLGDYLNDTFDPNGEYYNPDESFIDHQPGTYMHYSNTGMGLIGYLVEVLTGQPFNEFCNTEIFEPLEMDSTGFLLSDININDLAYKYEYDKRVYVKFPHYGFANYPDGGIKTRVQDWANFFQMYMNGGIRGTERILNESIIEEILTIQNSEIDEGQALGLSYTDCAIFTLWPFKPGHSGGDYGIMSQVIFDPETDNGVILFANFGPNTYLEAKPLYFDIMRRLLWEAEIEF